MLLNNLDELYEIGKVGDWCFVETKNENGPFLMLFLRYPVKEDDAKLGDWWPYSRTKEQGDVVSCPLSGSGHPIWQWDGNREAPTLSPSILISGGDGKGGRKERWHGFLRAGKLETV